MSRLHTTPLIVAALVAATTVPARAQGGQRATSNPGFRHEALWRAVTAATPSPGATGAFESQGIPTSATQRRSWDGLAAVPRGRPLIVTLADATEVRGRLYSIDSRSITVEQSEGLRTIAAADVVRVRSAGVRRRHVLRGMLIGSVAGAVGFVVIDQRSTHPSTKVEAAALGAVFVGLPVGALIGAALPTGPPLYEAAHAGPARPLSR